MREVRIRDTLSGELRPLEPRDPPRVGIYACGPTVYSRIHIGNARPYVVFMLLQRFLEHEGYDVTFASNVTDINDKIYVAARDAGVPSDQLAEQMTACYFEDTGRLDHIAFAATDVDAMRKRLQTRNVKFRESIVPRTGDTQFFLYDPDGVGVELNFPKP